MCSRCGKLASSYLDNWLFIATIKLKKWKKCQKHFKKFKDFWPCVLLRGLSGFRKQDSCDKLKIKAKIPRNIEDSHQKYMAVHGMVRLNVVSNINRSETWIGVSPVHKKKNQILQFDDSDRFFLRLMKHFNAKWRSAPRIFHLIPFDGPIS